MCKSLVYRMIVLAKKMHSYYFKIMIEENADINLKSLLEWYVLAGVEETAGDEPFVLDKKPEEQGIRAAAVVSALRKTAPAPAAVSESEVKRAATTELAQATVNACQNARELCKTATSIAELRKLVEGFDGCALKLTANKTVFGGGNEQAEVMLIGEAPGADEDRMGIPFVGRSGHLLDKIIQAAGLARDDVYITNVLPWRPPGNRTPTTAEVAVCLPFLRRQIELVKPKVLVLLGGSAANALLENEEPISRMRGKWLEYKTEDGNSVAVMATFHPAYLLRNAGQKAKIWADFLRLKKKIS